MAILASMAALSEPTSALTALRINSAACIEVGRAWASCSALSGEVRPQILQISKLTEHS